MINPNDPTQLQRLYRVMEHSDRVIGPHRRIRERLVRDYVGQFYGSMDTDYKKTYTNLMLQTAETYTQLLAGNSPRILVSTHYQELIPFAYHYQQAVNQLFMEIEAAETLRLIVLDAFFKMGIAKVYNADDANVLHLGGNQYANPGHPYFQRISLDDFVFDTNAQRWEKCRFYGDRYRVSYDAIMEDPDFDKKAKKQIEPTDRYRQNDDGEVPVRELTQQDTNAEEVEQMVDLIDLYLPMEKLIVTMQWSKDLKPPLKVVDYKGPEKGPYKKLAFVDIVDNIIPPSMGESLKPLHDLCNALLRKLARQSNRQKDLPIFEPGSEQDAKNITRAEDGEWTAVARREGVDILKTGGVDPGNHNFLMYATDAFDRMAGNLPLLAGLGAQSDTLGQDQMLQKSGSNRLSKMQHRVEKFTAELAESLGYQMWVNPVMEIPYEMQLEEADITIRDQWTPQQREGDWWQYSFRIEPYSMEYKSPQQRANALIEYVSGIAVPMQPMLEMMGGYIDVQALTDYWAELQDLPRLKQVVKFQQPSQSDMAKQQNTNKPPGQSPAQTTRVNVRRNIPSDAPSRNNQLQSLTKQSNQTSQGFQSARQ